MKFRPRRTLAALLSALLLLTLCAAPVRAQNSRATSLSPLHVKGTHLVDQSGNPVQLRGISTHGIAWYPDYINAACFRQLHDTWGANVIRLAMYTEEYGGYCSGGDQKQLKQWIDKGVSYATQAGMYVIIDWHILSDGDPNQHLSEAKSFFKEMAKKYAGYDNVLYEICNEPNGSATWNRVKSYAEKVIAVIRSYDSDAVILVGTPNWSQYVDQAANAPITKYDNLMYTLHFYAATHTDSLRNTMTRAIQDGLPVFVSEYGICDASGNGALDKKQANQWIKTLDQYGVSYVAWNLSNKAESSALLRSSCTKTSGFTSSDLSEAGKWVYQMLRSKAAVFPAAPALSTPVNTANGLTLQWRPVSGAAGYRIFRKTGSSAEWKILKTVGSNTLRYSDAAVSNGKLYRYTVRAYTVKNGKTVWSSYQKAGATAFRVEGTALASLKNNGKKTLTARWKRGDKITGYQLQYGTSKNFHGAKNVKISGAKNVSKRLSSLSKGKTYYVRVRCFRVHGGKTYYSAWSSTSTCAVRK